jgi:hypothetical protein
MIHIDDVSPVKSRTTLVYGGQSFSGRVTRIVASADGGRLYGASVSGVWRSDDGGGYWRQMSWPQPLPGTVGVPGSLPCPNVLAIWISPNNPDIVLAGVGHDARATPRNGIYRSIDGGATWTLVHRLLNPSRICTEIVSALDAPELIFAATETAIAVSHNGGTSFVDHKPWGNSPGRAWHVSVAPLDGAIRRVYALGSGRMWVSLNGGSTWAPDQASVPSVVGGPPDGRASGAAPAEFAATNGAPVLAVNPSHPEQVYVAGQDRSLWSVDYGAFATTGMGVWTQLPVPNGDASSGRFYIVAHRLPFGSHLLFHSDSNVVRVCSGSPLGVDSWHSIDPNNLNHVDPHGIAVSRYFVARVDSDGITYGGGTLWLSNDGGVSRSDDAGQSWTVGSCLSTLAPLNISAAFAKGQTALCIGTGDNIGFYSIDGGQNWKTQEYNGGDNDCCFVDPLFPSRLLVFAPRNDVSRPLRLYVNTSGGVPDGAAGTSQAIGILGPTPFPLDPDGSRRDAWTAVSSYVFAGYRPLVLTRPGEAPERDCDFVVIRTLPDLSRVVLRTTKMTLITAYTDWDTTASADGPGVKCFQQGPVLPTRDASIVQASGGHASPTFYVRDPTVGRMWKWSTGLPDWQEITFTTSAGTMFALGFFVDPYRPQKLYVIDRTSAAIHRSDNGGTTWLRDDSMTAAVTDNGAFDIPLSDSYYDTESIVNDMLFDPEDEGRRFAVAYSGAFYTVDGLHWGRMMTTTALPQHSQMATLDTLSDPCNHALYVATGGRGVLRLKPLPVAIRQVDVSRITGRRVVGPVTSWQTPNGPLLVEHLAGRDAAGHLLVFWWSPAHDWQVVDVTAITGRTIEGPLTSWQTPNGPYNVEHLAAADAAGHLLVFWWSPAHDWQVVDVTAKTGRTVAGGVSSWQTPNGPEIVEHLAARDAAGHLLVFYWAPSHDWRVVDVSAITGAVVIGTPTSWQTPNGPFNVEHLAARSPIDDLLVFWWSPAHDWQVVNVSSIAGPKVGGSPTSWQTLNGPYYVEHLAAAGQDGRLFVFYWSPVHDWQVVDLTARTGVRITGDVASWQTQKCRPANFEHLAANSTSGHLHIFTWSPENDWYATDVTALTNVRVHVGVSPWQTPNGPYNIEHLAAPSQGGDLIVFYTRASEVLTGRSDGPKACQG